MSPHSTFCIQCLYINCVKRVHKEFVEFHLMSFPTAFRVGCRNTKKSILYILPSFLFSFLLKYTAPLDDSPLFFLIPEHWFTWKKIVLFKKVNFGRKIKSRKAKKNVPKIKKIKLKQYPFFISGFLTA